MTYFTKDGVSSCQIAGAVAEAAIHDLKVNRFSFSGFPEISVPDPIDNVFTITLNWQPHYANITLTRSEAVAAAKWFIAKKGFDPIIFDRVQKALVSLEGQVSAS